MLIDPATVSEQIQKVWGAIGPDEFTEMAPIASVLNRTFEGMINKQNDEVYVSQVNEMEARNVQVGTPGDTNLESTTLSTTRIGIKADRVFSISLKIADLTDLQTQLGSPDGKSAIRASMLKALVKKVNDHIYATVSPSLAAPDHSISGVTAFDEAQFANNTILADQAYWPADDRFAFLDPSYHADALQATGLSSADYAPDTPKVGGQFMLQRYGWNIVKDNSRGLLKAGAASDAGTADRALLFHREFMHLVMGPQIWKLSDLHANSEIGYLVSCHFYGGTKLAIEGDKKHILVYST